MALRESRRGHRLEYPCRSCPRARLHARGLPPEVGWADLLQEAFARVLDGSRKCPAGLPRVVFMAGVIRSIRTEHCRRARRAAARLPRIFAELDLCGPENEARDPTPDPEPERSLMAMQQLAEIDRLFADDSRALQIIEGLFEGRSPYTSSEPRESSDGPGAPGGAKDDPLT